MSVCMRVITVTSTKDSVQIQEEQYRGTDARPFSTVFLDPFRSKGARVSPLKTAHIEEVTRVFGRLALEGYHLMSTSPSTLTTDRCFTQITATYSRLFPVYP